MAKEREEDFDRAHEATISRWTRDRERTEDKIDHMKKSINKAISGMLKNKHTKSDVARDLKNATQNKFDPDKVFNGYQETGENDAEIADYIANNTTRNSGGGPSNWGEDDD